MSRNVIIITAVAIVLLAGTGCRPSGISYGVATIVGSLTHYQSADRESTVAEVDVSGTKLLPVVAINSDTLELTNYDAAGEYLWKSTWRRFHVPAVLDTNYVLHVYQSDGEAKSQPELLPPRPAVVAPDTLRQGQDLTVTWTPATKIDRYQAQVHAAYTYHNFQHFVLDTTVILPPSLNSLTIPAAALFPADVDTVNVGSGFVSITAESGPSIGRETKGNVSGNGTGYFVARNTDSHTFSIRRP
jgi:hypothetical protein